MADKIFCFAFGMAVYCSLALASAYQGRAAPFASTADEKFI
jgi:hypothetical protein